MNELFLVLSAWGLSSLIMGLLWLLYLKKGDPAVVDIGWGGSIGLGASLLYFLAPNYSVCRQELVTFLVALWSLRISALLVSRMLKGQKDRRYKELSRKWEKGRHWKYFLFFQAQALTVGILLIPVALTLLSSTESWSLWDSLGLGFFTLGLAGESWADRQMACFRSDPNNAKKVCKVGFWYYSRHPNYFFEWIIWLSFAIFAANHPSLWYLGWLSPCLILYSILKVTGIPPTEERLLASKGSAYEEYQKTTNAFIPWWPRS